MSKLSVFARTSLAVAIVATASGCSWFHHGSDKLYAGSAESRPLEVPPDLDATATTPATSASATASGTQQAAATSSALGFTVQGTRDDVFTRVGTALGGVAGLTIANRAPLIGAYDVNYSGSNFLVRVAAAEGGVYVSAVDPRGLPATGDAARRLVGALKAALAP